MLLRFASNLVLGVLAGALAAMSLLFAPGVVRWLALGGGCAAFGLIAAAFLTRGRGPVQRWLDLVAALVAAWTIVAACCFTGHTLRWLSFSEFAALLACGLGGLIAHEAVMERAARTPLTVAGAERRDGFTPQRSERPNGERVMVG